MAYEKQTWANGDTITAPKLNNIEGGVEDMNNSYEKQTWVTGEVITAEKLNHIEDGIANGSGSSSNIVYGSFTTQGVKGVQNIDVPYSGKGYPIEVIIYPTDSYGFAAKSESSLSDMTGRNGIIVWQGFKMSSEEAPVYGQNHGIVNEMTTIVALKEYYNDSTTDRFQTSESCYPFSYAEASEPSNRGDGWEPYLDNTVVVLTETGISIFVRGDDAGFFQNTEYAYRIIYSE